MKTSAMRKPKTHTRAGSGITMPITLILESQDKCDDRHAILLMKTHL